MIIMMIKHSMSAAQMWGNLISSLVLSNRPDNASDISEEDLQKCGRNFCPEVESASNGSSAGLEAPPQDLVSTCTGENRSTFIRFHTLTLLMMRPLLSKAQELKKIIENHLNPVMLVFIGALIEYLHLSTHFPGLSAIFQDLLISFCISQISHQQHMG